MKKLHLLKTVFLLCALVVGSMNVWGATKTEGFETKATATNYQGTVNIAANESDCGIAWTIYYGCVSTNDKISGNRSAQMRWYQTASANYPYIKTTTAVDGLSNITLKARASSTNLKMDICYSSNGTTWTVGKTHTFSAANTAENESLDIPSGNKYVKFEVNSSSTVPGTGSNYKLIIDDVVFTYTSSVSPATWSVNPTSALVTEGESTTLQLTTNYDGTLNFQSNDASVATVSYNSITKEITVNGIAPGTTTISATGAATSSFEAIDKTINVTVAHTEFANNYCDVMGTFGYTYFGLTPTGSNTYAQPDVEQTAITDSYGVTLTLITNSGTDPRYDSDYMRIYNKNKISIDAPTGSYITKIVFTEPGTGASWSGTFTVNNGDYLDAVKTWYATADDISSVTFTSDNTKRIAGLKVYMMVSNTSATISNAEYATFVSPYATDFSTSGITVYTATDEETQATLNIVANGKVPANTPVVLHKAGADGSAINVPVIASADALAGTNDLRVSTGTDVEHMYVLSKKNDKVGFRAWNGTSDLSAGKVYLLGKASYGAREFIGFGETTSIMQVENGSLNTEDFFNLNGQRVAQPTKGLYIVNGKKVVIK